MIKTDLIYLIRFSNRFLFMKSAIKIISTALKCLTPQVDFNGSVSFCLPVGFTNSHLPVYPAWAVESTDDKKIPNRFVKREGYV